MITLFRMCTREENTQERGHLMSITYTQHPRFEFGILVDLYVDGSTSIPLSITNVAHRL